MKHLYESLRPCAKKEVEAEFCKFFKMAINEEGTVIAVDSDVLYEVADRKGEGEHVTFKVTTSEGETSKEVAWEVE